MNRNVIKGKERLIEKKSEMFDVWQDLVNFMTPYLEKLKCVVEEVIDESNSLVFFQTYPKVSSHIDKILNLFVQVQCEFEMLSCDEILNCNPDFRDATIRNVPELSDVVKTPKEDKDNKTHSDDSTTPQSNNDPKVQHGDSFATLGSLVEYCSELPCAFGETCAPILNVFENDKTIPAICVTQDDKCFPNVEKSSLCMNASVVPTSKVFKQRIPQCVVSPNEVLEMAYSHGDNPWNFWLCFYPYCDIEHIQNNIKTMYYTNKLEHLTEVPCVGDHVLVADGERFLRGQVLSIRNREIEEDTSLMLFDVDSGRMKSFKLRHIWKLSEDFVSIQAQALNCQLYGILGESSAWCKENLRKCKMLHKFEELILNTTLSVIFIKSLGASSVSRYVIDADCINTETDKIFNVTQVINDTIVPFITMLSRQEVREIDNIITDVVSQKSHQPVTDCLDLIQFHETSHSDVIANEVTLDRASQIPSQSDTDCIDLLQIYETSHLDVISNDKVSLDTVPHKLHQPITDCLDLIQFCEPSHSEAISNVEAMFEADLDVNGECENDVAYVEIIPTQNKDKGSVPMSSSYCNKDVTLENRNYSFLLNQTIVCFPRYIDSPSVFYMEILLDESDEFGDLHKAMNKFYSKNKVEILTKDSAKCYIKSYCAAMYPEDRQWYRAEIVDWLPATERSLYVRFVDIGDRMVIEFDLIQPLVKQFAIPPILAQKCHLHGIAPIDCETSGYMSYEWSASALSLFRSFINVDRFYNMQLLNFTLDGSIAVLLINPTCIDTSINKELISFGVAKYLLEDDLALWDPMKEEYERNMHDAYDDEDACVAVTGYSPKDEQRFCKFYARNGRCYKGNNCRKEHVISHPSGWFSDKREVFQDAFSHIFLPETGETVYLQVTCVVRLNLFYVILNFDSNSEEETLLTLNRYINEKQNLKNMKLLDITPAVGQLVLAHYQQDGIWYRARVIDTDNDSNCIQVFFVDYGNTEWVSESCIRDIDPKYLHLPFQAIESSLAFAEMNASVDDDSLEKVISTFRCLTNCVEPLKGKVISKDDNLKKLELQLYDVNGQDIALMLADTGYVRITTVQMTPATAFAVPG